MLARIYPFVLLLIALTAITTPAEAGAAAAAARHVIACMPLPAATDLARAEDRAAAAQQVQRRLLAAVAPTTAELNRQYTYLPCLAFDATPAALASFQSAAAGVSIVDDTLTFSNLAESTATIGAPAAQAMGATGAGQSIAVLDTGVDASHPFLAGKVVAQACFSNANGRGSGASLCPGSAGTSLAAGAGLNCQIEGCGHGTHVAGIAAGRATGSISFSGVAPDATIIAVQVFTRFESGCGSAPAPCVASYTSDQLAALEYIYTLRAQFSIAAVNMSLGSSVRTSACDTDSRKDAIDLLRAANIATVVSAGNQGSSTGLSAPACVSSAISVGSTGDGSYGASADRVSSYSNSAAFLSLLAPGQGIQSSVPGSYAVMSGTSMAAPHVAGAWALLKSQKPGATVSEVLQALRSSAPITDTRNNLTTPRIQLEAAVSALLGLPRAAAEDITIDEGSAGQRSAAVAVRLSAASDTAVTLRYATADGTARAGSDYAATSGTLTIPAGAESGIISVPVQADALDEDDEQFGLVLSEPSGALLARSSVAITLRNDDLPPDISLSDTTIVAQRAAFTIRLSAPSGRPITVDYAVSGSSDDGEESVTIAAGAAEQVLEFAAASMPPGSPEPLITLALLGSSSGTITRGWAMASPGTTDSIGEPAQSAASVVFVPVAQRFAAGQ